MNLNQQTLTQIDWKVCIHCGGTDKVCELCLVTAPLKVKKELPASIPKLTTNIKVCITKQYN